MIPAPTLVLVEPKDVVNVASAVRIAKNFGIERMRLVNPRVFDPWRIEGIAHNSVDLVERIEVVGSLEEAVADCVFVAALTARERTAKRRTLRPREAALELAAQAARGPVAIVAGREESGLKNEEIDRCHLLVTIATDPGYRSLNLAQAVAILCYETFVARGGEEQPIKPPRKEAEPASSAQMEALFADWEKALWAIEFFKTRLPESVMRSVRDLLFRADLDGREATLLRAMGLEIVRFMQRKGLSKFDSPQGPGLRT